MREAAARSPVFDVFGGAVQPAAMSQTPMAAIGRVNEFGCKITARFQSIGRFGFEFTRPAIGSGDCRATRNGARATADRALAKSVNRHNLQRTSRLFRLSRSRN